MAGLNVRTTAKTPLATLANQTSYGGVVPAAGPVLAGWPGPEETEAQKTARLAANAELSAQWQLQQAAAKAAADAAETQRQYATEQTAALMGQIPGLMGTLGLGGGSAGTTGPVTSAPLTPPTPVAAPTAPPRVAAPGAEATVDWYARPGSTQGAAEAATWARAKDVIGRQTGGALKTLQGLQAARGFGKESGVYGEQEGLLVSEGLRSLGEVARTQAEEAAAAQREREKMVYEGDITQRGQDLGLTGAGYSGGITQRGQDVGLAEAGLSAGTMQRGQDIEAYLSKLGLIPSLLSLFRQGAY